jgi:trans-feruloyl-CoA hydratase/vanillin synthase
MEVKMSNFQTVKIERSKGIAWLYFNRPEKRNAMSPTLNKEMLVALDEIERDGVSEVLVLTGAGDAFSAGMDLKEYFREVDGKPAHVQSEVRRIAGAWQYQRLRSFPLPTIAMVNGWCFGGAFTPLVSCDIAIAADDAQFGLSEINWGILPGGVVTRDVAAVMSYRNALFYILTGRPFDGRKAAELGLVTLSVPATHLRDEVVRVANELKTKNPATLRACKEAFKTSLQMSWEEAQDYLYAKLEQMQFRDKAQGRKKGLQQFLDDKTYKPGLGSFDRGVSK